MKEIIEREFTELRSRYGQAGVIRLREMLIQDENTWRISETFGISNLAVVHLRNNLSLFLQVVERPNVLRLVYHKVA